jgi:hypothetical protein
MATLDQDDLDAIAALLQPIQNDLTALLQMQVGNGTAIEAFTTAGGTRLVVAIQGSVTGNVNGFTITASGGAVTVLDFELKKISTQEITAVILRLSRTIAASERVYVGYTSNPGSGGGNLFVDSSFVPSFSNVLVRTESGIDALVQAINDKTQLITNGAVRVWPVVSSFGSIVDVALPVGQVTPITLPSGDYQALTLEVVWEEEGDCLDGGSVPNVATVANANITKAADSITFAIPAAVAAQKQTLIYSVRDTVNGRLELIGGTWTVRAAAN